MARKKDNFDPLGGFVGGPAKPNKKSKRVNDLLGSGKNSGSGSIYDEGDYTPSYSGRTDALTATGEAVPEKKKKRGFFFGHKEKPQKIHEPPKDSGFDSSEYKLEIKNGVMDTGIAERYVEETPADDYSEYKYEEKIIDEPVSEPVAEEDDFFEDDVSEIVEPKTPEIQRVQHSDIKVNVEDIQNPLVVHKEEHDMFEPKTPEIQRVPHSDIMVNVEDIQNPLVHKEEPVQHHRPNVCFLCGEASSDALPQFGFGDGSNPNDFVPLCKTCLHAVTTLMKFRDPSDEAEIKNEWRTLCPGLDDSRADGIISEGRKHH